MLPPRCQPRASHPGRFDGYALVPMATGGTADECKVARALRDSDTVSALWPTATAGPLRTERIHEPTSTTTACARCTRCTQTVEVLCR